jgi:acyl-coenzyme A synthetase/AMP-(fatty) acid ligase
LAAELIEHCRAALARFKCPRQIDFIDVLPRQDNGKIYKRQLRDRYRMAAENTEGKGMTEPLAAGPDEPQPAPRPPPIPL